jgi:hypothetical protein
MDAASRIDVMNRVSKSLITAHAVYQERFIEYPLKKINIKGPDIPSGPFIFI